MTDITKIVHTLSDVREEVLCATDLHRPMVSLHEAYGIIAEEFREFEQQVFLKAANRDPENVQKELTQIAAMAVRAMVDLKYNRLDNINALTS